MSEQNPGAKAAFEQVCNQTLRDISPFGDNTELKETLRNAAQGLPAEDVADVLFDAYAQYVRNRTSCPMH